MNIARTKSAVAKPGPIPFSISLLMVLWLLAMIAIPILLWTVGESALPQGMTVGVILQAGAVLAILLHGLGRRSVFRGVAIILPFAWLLELIGSSTGLPFGYYHYTDLLIPQVRHVPLIIPFSWLMMLAPSWAIAAQICGNSRGPAFVFLSGLGMMAWDLYLDPQMVGWGFWVWEEQSMFLGGYFGIPWLNYFGWMLGSALLTWFVTLAVDLEPLFGRNGRMTVQEGGREAARGHGGGREAARGHGGGREAARGDGGGREAAPLRVIYGITWLFEFGGLAFFWGLVGPALCGFVGMGMLLLWGRWECWRKGRVAGH